jgi:hypothetical protein
VNARGMLAVRRYLFSFLEGDGLVKAGGRYEERERVVQAAREVAFDCVEEVQLLHLICVLLSIYLIFLLFGFCMASWQAFLKMVIMF